MKLKLSDGFKKKLRGAFEVLCVSIINFFGVKLWSRMSIVLGLATWLLYIGKITGAEWLVVVGMFISGDLARSKLLNNSPESANGASTVEKITQALGIKK